MGSRRNKATNTLGQVCLYVSKNIVAGSTNAILVAHHMATVQKQKVCIVDFTDKQIVAAIVSDGSKAGLFKKLLKIQPLEEIGADLFNLDENDKQLEQIIDDLRLAYDFIVFNYENNNVFPQNIATLSDYILYNFYLEDSEFVHARNWANVVSLSDTQTIRKTAFVIESPAHDVDFTSVQIENTVSNLPVIAVIKDVSNVFNHFLLEKNLVSLAHDGNYTAALSRICRAMLHR